MEKRDPARQRTTSIRKPDAPAPDPAEPAPDPDPAAAAPAPPAPANAPPKPAGAGLRRRTERAGPGGKKYSVGEKMVKTSKPPSRLGAAVKMVLILVVFLGIPGIVTAGFFVKDTKGRNVWVKLLQKFGLFKGETAVAAEKPRHPNLVGFDQTCGLLQNQKSALLAVRRKIEECDQKKIDVPPELAAELHEILDKIQPKISDCQDLFSQQAAWIKHYNTLLGEAEEAFKGVQGDEKKMRATEFLLGGEVPAEFEEAAKDPAVVKYVEICLKLERDKYQDVLLEDEKINDQARDAGSCMVQIRQLRGRLGSRLAGDAPPPSKPETPRPEPEKPKPEPEKPKPEPAPAAIAVPKLPHPWGAFKAGAWIRTKTVVAAGETKTEIVADTTIVEVKEDGVAVRVETLGPDGKVSATDQVIPLSAGETKALREEKVKVGTDEVDSVVLETAGVRAWMAKGGPTAGLAALKTEGAEFSDSVNEVGEETLQVGGRAVRCVTLFSEGKRGEAAVQGALWVAGEVPGFVLKRVMISGETRTTVEVTAFGDETGSKPELMAKKPEPEKPKPEPEKPKPEPEKPKPEPEKPEAPKPDPPKPEPEKPKEKTVDVVLAEAGKAVIEGAGLARQIADGLASPSLDAEQLKTLLAKKEVAIGYLTQARETYTVNKDKASDPAAIERRLGLIEKVIANLQKYEDEIKSRMK